MRNYSSDEKFDLSKFMDFQENVYDVINSPFLAKLSQLQTVDYYDVDKGYRDIDMIATDYYGDQFLAYLIQFYNNDFRDRFPEGTKLNMFSIDDLNELFLKLSVQSNIEEA
jgi:hypothetical protein